MECKAKKQTSSWITALWFSKMQSVLLRLRGEITYLEKNWKWMLSQQRIIRNNFFLYFKFEIPFVVLQIQSFDNFQVITSLSLLFFQIENRTAKSKVQRAKPHRIGSHPQNKQHHHMENTCGEPTGASFCRTFNSLYAHLRFLCTQQAHQTWIFTKIPIFRVRAAIFNDFSRA